MKTVRTDITSTDLSSVLIPTEPVTQTLTTKFWNIDWSGFFPFVVDGGITLEVSTFEEFNTFAALHFKQIYDKPQAGFVQESFEQKRAYYQSCGDFFAFRHEGKIVGVFVGNAQDWSTYYLRSGSILPEYQGLKIFQNFVRRLLECLEAHKVGRVEVQVAPSNLANIHLFNKLGFQVTGFNVSERWGALVQLTRFYDEERADSFVDRYCYATTRHGARSAGRTISSK